nr:hypothetical protein [uncultured bacterium]
MERKSSINIRQGESYFFWHNSRESSTVNSIFDASKNEVDRSAKKAIELYNAELQKRAEAYTKRTGQKLQKKVIKHLSAVINLGDRHTLQDVRKIADFLEQTLDTKIVQIAVHKDEGHVDENGVKHINYHAHLEFLGLDSKGYSIRRKLNRKYLQNLQTQVAKILGMRRGEKGSKKKRIEAHTYKKIARRIEIEKKEKKKH